MQFVVWNRTSRTASFDPLYASMPITNLPSYHIHTCGMKTKTKRRPTERVPRMAPTLDWSTATLPHCYALSFSPCTSCLFTHIHCPTLLLQYLCATHIMLEYHTLHTYLLHLSRVMQFNNTFITESEPPHSLSYGPRKNQFQSMLMNVNQC